MPLVVSAVVARDDDDGVVVDARVFYGLDDATNAAVNTDKIVVIILSVPTFVVPDAIDAVKTRSKEDRLFVLDVCNNITGKIRDSIQGFLTHEHNSLVLSSALSVTWAKEPK